MEPQRLVNFESAFWCVCVAEEAAPTQPSLPTILVNSAEPHGLHVVVMDKFGLVLFVRTQGVVLNQKSTLQNRDFLCLREHHRAPGFS